MKSFKFSMLSTMLFAVLICFTQCKPSITTDNLLEFEKDLKSKFGNNAFYTNISIGNDKAVGSIVNVTATNDPSSLKMTEWKQMCGTWEETADVTMEIEDGSADEFMFSLGKEVSMAKANELLLLSKKKLADEKQINTTFVTLLMINTPSRGTKAESTYMISLEPENGGTAFNFIYDLSGKLISFTF